MSIAVRVSRANWNAMKPRIRRVLAQWNPGFIASGSRPSAGRTRSRPGSSVLGLRPVGVRRRVWRPGG